MDVIGHLKDLIDTHDLNKAQLAKEIGMSKQQFHYFLNTAKSCNLSTYTNLRKAIESRGIRVDELDTLSITGLAAHVNTEASKLIADCIQAMEDGVLTEDEKTIIRSSVDTMINQLNIVKGKLQ